MRLTFRHGFWRAYILLFCASQADAKGRELEEVKIASPTADEGSEGSVQGEESVVEGEKLPASKPVSEPAICSSDVTRPLSEVVIQFESDFSTVFEGQFVDLRAGETICLIFDAEEDGTLIHPRVIQAGGVSDRPLRLSLTTLTEAEPDGTRATLTIDNPFNESIVLSAARAGTVPGLMFFEDEAMVVMARSRVIRRLRGVVPRVLFAHFSLGRSVFAFKRHAPRDTPRRPASPPPPIYEDYPTEAPLLSNQPPSRSVVDKKQRDRHQIPQNGVRGALDMYALGGMIFNHSGDLEDVVQDNGFASLPHHQELMGFGFGLTIKRVRIAWDLFTSFSRNVESEDEGEDAKLNQTIITLEGGYDIYRYGGFSLTPWIGLSAGDIRVRTHPDNPALLSDQISGYYNNETVVRRNVFSVRGELGVQHLIPFGGVGDKIGFVYGARAGYQQQFSQSGWLPDSDDKNAPELNGGPKVNASGPFIHLFLGMSVYLL